MAVMFRIPFLPTGEKESQSYFNCRCQAVQFQPLVTVVSPLNALNQIDAKKHKNVSRKTCSFLNEKLQSQSLKKSWAKINIISAVATHGARKQF